MSFSWFSIHPSSHPPTHPRTLPTHLFLLQFPHQILYLALLLMEAPVFLLSYHPRYDPQAQGRGAWATRAHRLGVPGQLRHPWVPSEAGGVEGDRRDWRGGAHGLWCPLMVGQEQGRGGGDLHREGGQGGGPRTGAGHRARGWSRG